MFNEEVKKQYIEELDQRTTKSTIMNLFKQLEPVESKYNCDFCEANFNVASDMIKSILFKNIGAANRGVSALRLYKIWCFNNKITNQKIHYVDMLTKEDIASLVDTNVEMSLYFNHMQYEKYISQLECYQYNSLYYTTLFMAIYEGILGKQSSEIYNLRLSSITGENEITLSNGAKLSVSKKLILNIRSLSQLNEWETLGANGNVRVERLAGLYEDSVFKFIERDNSTSQNLNMKINSKVRNILNILELENSGSTKIYYSGLLYHIAKRCKEDEYTMDYLFTTNTNGINDIIGKYMIEFGCNVNVAVFKRQMKRVRTLFE